MKSFAWAAYTLAAAVSASLFLGVAIFWVRSYYTIEFIEQLKMLDPPTLAISRLRGNGPTSALRQFECQLINGSIWMDVGVAPIGGIYPSAPPGPRGWQRTSLPIARYPASVEGLSRTTLGFGYEHRRLPYIDFRPEELGVSASEYARLPPDVESWTVQIPCWLLAAIAAASPLALARSLWRRRRFAAGHCVKCGYDLRGTPAKCPECGTIVKRTLNRSCGPSLSSR